MSASEQQPQQQQASCGDNRAIVFKSDCYENDGQLQREIPSDGSLFPLV